nr:response regulator [uncultured Acetatifactor sp.]
MKVMIIDDESVHVRGMIRHINWEKYGFEPPIGYTDAMEALLALKRNLFNVVITDIKMPGISGLELIRSIHEEGMNPTIIIISGYEEFSYAQEAIRLGVYAYLLKPLKPEELEACLDNIQSRLAAECVDKIKPDTSGLCMTGKKVMHPSIKKIIQYVKKNYEKDLTIRGLAEIFDMNADYLSALFKKETDMNLNSFINITRLSIAHKLLEETDCRISEVAFQAGFSNPGYFTKQFRSFYGYTPSEIRKKP